MYVMRNLKPLVVARPRRNLTLPVEDYAPAVLTIGGLHGYRLYRDGRLPEAHRMLALYSLTGLTTPLHFLSGNPEIPAFFYATIFTDGIAGLAILAFVLASASADETVKLWRVADGVRLGQRAAVEPTGAA